MSAFSASFTSLFPGLKGKIDLFLVNLDGTGYTPITEGLQGYNFVQDISPDGRQILVGSVSNLAQGTNDTYGDLYVMNLDGSNPVKLTSQYALSPYGGINDAYWLTDGKSIVYIGKENNANAIFLIAADGTGRKRLTSPSDNPIELDPSSSDAVIYFGTGQLGVSTSYRKLNMDGSGEQKIWDGLSVDSFSRLGNRIVFRDFAHNKNFVADYAGNKQIEIDTADSSPGWLLSPDGSKILYARGGQVYLETFADSSKTVLASSDHCYLSGMTWSPDSRLILRRCTKAYVGNGQNVTASDEVVNIVNIETRDVQQITTQHDIVWLGFWDVIWIPSSH